MSMHSLSAEEIKALSKMGFRFVEAPIQTMSRMGLKINEPTIGSVTDRMRYTDGETLEIDVKKAVFPPEKYTISVTKVGEFVREIFHHEFSRVLEDLGKVLYPDVIQIPLTICIEGNEKEGYVSHIPQVPNVSAEGFTKIDAVRELLALLSSVISETSLAEKLNQNPLKAGE